MTDLATTFRKPFAEQVAAFRLRLANLVPTVRWDDISHNQHDRAFMVAGALKADLLADLAAAVDKAVAQGTTLEEFQRDFRAIVEKNGWHGWTGEGTVKGEAWRTRVIYRTNLATSYAAGRRTQLIAGNFKFWVYRHGGSLEPRLQHLAWDGIALPPDHPFWAMHAPPNGWGCSCRIFGARSEAGIRRVGGVPGKTLPAGWDQIDPRTGTQVGIDKGWGYAPGATVAEDVLAAIARKSETLPTVIARDLADIAAVPANLTSADDFEALLARLADDQGQALAAIVRAAAAYRVDERLSLTEKMAIDAYSRSAYHGSVNHHLRQRARGDAGLDADLAQLADIIEGTLTRLPMRPGLSVRGISEPSQRMVDWFSQIAPGDQFSFEALTSSSSAEDRAFTGTLRFIIQGLTGRPIEHLSAHRQEAEVLFPPGLQFRVLARTYNADVTTIWVEELRPHRWRVLPEEAMHAVLG